MEGQNGQLRLFLKIFCNLPLFEICSDLPLIGNSSLENLSFSWYSSSRNLSSIKNSMANLKAIFSKNSSSHGKFEGYFFKELKFLKLELHSKLEFQKGGRLLNILQTIVDQYIFFQTMVYGHFG